MAAALVLILPLSARSEIKEGQFEFSPFAGYNFFESRQNLENQAIFGGRLGYNFTKNFAIEAVGEHIGSRVDDDSETWTEVGQFASPTDNVNINFYHLDLLYHFKPEEKFNPFIAAGYGAANYNPEMIDGGNMAIINFGLGAKYWMTDNFALRFDLRDNVVYDESLHNVESTVGVVFALGRKAKPAPAPVAVHEPAPKPKVEEKVVVLSFEDIPFDFDKADINQEAKEILKRNIQVLKANSKAKIRISGHASLAGTEAYNQKLSEKRAEAVYEYLIKEGNVPPKKLVTVGYGETRPAVHEPNPKEIHSKAAKANMRVLLEIIE